MLSSLQNVGTLERTMQRHDPSVAFATLPKINPAGVERIKAVLKEGHTRWLTVTLVLFFLVCALTVTMMCVGNTIYSPAEIWHVLTGGEAEAHTLRSVWDYRLPRIVAALLVGFAFGIAGNTFQTMLRNPLASPDVIGITSGSSVAAVFCLLILHMGAGETSGIAVLAALIVAAAIYGLANIGGFSAGKLILVGLGIQAMAKACTSFLLLKGAEFDVATALRWLSGSLNGVTMEETIPLVVIIPLAVAAILLGRRLRILELGEEAATTLVPDGVRVADLVARGRFPYQPFMGGMKQEDLDAVNESMQLMGVDTLADRCVDELSGGQRQRVWIAMALAQQTEILLLDEPTTYLDIAYQIEILDLLATLNRERKTTVVMVLHDINLSSRYAAYMFALRKGELYCEGTPQEVVTEKTMRDVFELDCMIISDPVSGSPFIVPKQKAVAV
ncbi:MAG: iron chelate uptake ABC transporter family permease subunit [Coriobacteriales bacterium]|nr:iron chelate uptake ABC transporter family permease subunit [Coriobacteriales bacterium]